MKHLLFFTTVIAASWAIPSINASDQTGAEESKRPVSAKVVDAAIDAEPKIGNIEVTYADGTTDRWTTRGNTGDPRVAPDGTVGWTVYGPETKIPASYTIRPNGTVVICRRGKVLCRVNSVKMNIEEWGFIDGGSRFVLKTRGHHGPAEVELHDTATGKLLESSPAFGDSLPKWAEPYRE